MGTLFDEVSYSVKEAEQNILEMEAELKSLQSKIPQLQDEGNFFPDYNKAKRYLRETRQELRELAHRTVTDVKLLTKPMTMRMRMKRVKVNSLFYSSSALTK